MTLCTMKHLICVAIALSVVWLPYNGVCGGRRELQMSTEGLEMPLEPSPSPLAQSEVLFLDKLLAATNENRDAYAELQKYHRRQPNYLVKWPGLRDLLLTAVDYDNNVDFINLNNQAYNYELANSRLMQRLRQLSAALQYNGELENIREHARELNQIPKNFGNSAANQLPLKALGSKKSIQFRKQFMAPCHFKVCYIGPKRNIQY